MISPSSPVEILKNIGPKRSSALAEIEIYSVKEFIDFTSFDEGILKVAGHLGIKQELVKEIRATALSGLKYRETKSLKYYIWVILLTLIILFNLSLIIGGLLTYTNTFTDSRSLSFNITILEKELLEQELPLDQRHGYRIEVLSKTTSFGYSKTRVLIRNRDSADLLDKYPQGIPICILFDNLSEDTNITNVKATIYATRDEMYEAEDKPGFITVIEGKPELVIELPTTIERIPNLWHSDDNYFIWIDTTSIPAESDWDRFDNLYFELEAEFQDDGFEKIIDFIKPGTITVYPHISIDMGQFLGMDRKTAGPFILPEIFLELKKNNRPSYVAISWTSDLSGNFISPEELIGAKRYFDSETFIFDDNDNSGLIQAYFVFQSKGLQWLPYLAGIVGFSMLATVFKVWKKIKQYDQVEALNKNQTEDFHFVRLENVKIGIIKKYRYRMFFLFALLFIIVFLSIYLFEYIPLKRAEENTLKQVTPWMPIMIEAIPQGSTVFPTPIINIPTESISELDLLSLRKTGGQVVFASNVDGDYDLYSMNIDGTELLKITDNDYDEYRPSWSPDKSQIAFEAIDTGSDTEIFIMKVDGTNIKQLTQNDSNDYKPAWSPDGKIITFVSSTPPSIFQDIFQIDLTSAKVKRITDLKMLSRGRVSVVDFSWSPDGKMIAYTANRGKNGTSEIFVKDINIAIEYQLTKDVFNDYEPSWSPDGKRIVFRSHQDGAEIIFVIDSDGNNLMRLYQNRDNEMIWSPNWSPDGKKIIYVSGTEDILSFYVMNDDGSKIIKIPISLYKMNWPDWGK